jgi:hypothetical protein
MAGIAIPGMAVMYIRSTGDDATISGPSLHGDGYIHLKGFYSEAPDAPDSE